MISIPIAQVGAAFFQQRVELDGVPFILDFAWVARAGEAGSWALSLLTDEGAALVSGITIVSNRLLWSRFRYIEGMPLGDILFPSRGEDLPVPGFTDLNELIYFTGAERTR